MSFAQCSLAAWKTLRQTSKRDEFVEFCNLKYELIPLFRWFLSYFKENFWPLIILCFAAMPIIFTNVKYIADEFISKSIMRFQKRFKISQLIGAVTLIPLANAGPDLIVTFVSAQKDQGEDIAMGSMLGAFVFVATIAIGYSVFRSPNSYIKVPRLSFVKDVAFYCVGIFMLVLFGFLKRTKKFYAVLPVALLLTYILSSIYLAQREDAEVQDVPDISFEEKSIKNEAHLDFMSYTWRHLYDSSEPVFSVLFMPFKVFYMLIIPYNENPLARTHLIYVVLAISVGLSMLGFDVGLSKKVISAVSVLLALAIFGVCQIKSVSVHRSFILDFFTLVVSIACMKVLTDALLGAINFISFVLGVDENYLSMIVLSIGMSISDLFSNAAISASGDDVMAVMGCISSQIFNLFAGVSSYILFNAKGSFDIFGLAKKEVGSEKGLFVILVAFGFGALAINVAQVLAQKRYTKSFTIYSALFYLLFLGITAFYSVFGQ